MSSADDEKWFCLKKQTDKKRKRIPLFNRPREVDCITMCWWFPTAGIALRVTCGVGPPFRQAGPRAITRGNETEPGLKRAKIDVCIIHIIYWRLIAVNRAGSPQGFEIKNRRLQISLAFYAQSDVYREINCLEHALKREVGGTERVIQGNKNCSAGNKVWKLGRGGRLTAQKTIIISQARKSDPEQVLSGTNTMLRTLRFFFQRRKTEAEQAF